MANVTHSPQALPLHSPIKDEPMQKKRVRTKGWYLKTYNGRKLQNLQM